MTAVSGRRAPSGFTETPLDRSANGRGAPVAVCHAFIDESRRQSGYYVATAVTVADQVSAARQLARGFLLPGQRRWHFTEESDRRRRQILAAIVGSELVRVAVAHGSGPEPAVRARCLRDLTPALLQAGVTRVVIESRAGRDYQDRQVLARALRGVDHPFTYDHLTPAADAALWLADGVAWSISKGGSWRETVGPIVDFDRDVARIP
jgi:hypothetical protein